MLGGYQVGVVLELVGGCVRMVSIRPCVVLEWESVP